MERRVIKAREEDRELYKEMIFRRVTEEMQLKAQQE